MCRYWRKALPGSAFDERLRAHETVFWPWAACGIKTAYPGYQQGPKVMLMIAPK
jgi:hypothetical protein